MPRDWGGGGGWGDAAGSLQLQGGGHGNLGTALTQAAVTPSCSVENLTKREGMTWEQESDQKTSKQMCDKLGTLSAIS